VQVVVPLERAAWYFEIVREGMSNSVLVGSMMEVCIGN
jgi:hypothetical protein